MNRLFKPRGCLKPPKVPSLASQYWSEFVALAIEKGFKTKVVGDLAFMNKKGQYFRLKSTIGGVLKVYDGSTNKTYDILRKVN